MKPLMMRRAVLWALAAGCCIAMSAAGQTHVNPTNNPSPADQDAIQAAINSLGSGGGTVVLHGTFKFGPNDGVRIVQPNITLMGADDATIIGGGTENAAAGVWYVIDVENVGVQIKNLTLKDFEMDGILVRIPCSVPADSPVVIESNAISTAKVFPSLSSYGIYVRPPAGCPGCPVKILSNNVSAVRAALFVSRNPGDITVSGNTLTGGSLGALLQTNRTIMMSGNTLTGAFYGANIQQTSSQCTVTDNTVYTGPTGEGLNVVTSGDGPVLISGNTIHGGTDGIYVSSLGMTNHTTPVEISNNFIEPSFTGPTFFSTGIYGTANTCPLNIVNNTVRVIADRPGDNPTRPNFGVFLGAWNGAKGLDQDNPPVLIKENQFEIRYPFPEQPVGNLQSCGIVLGTGNGGINNVTVQSNKFSGTTTRGIYVNSYDRNILVEGNDLAGLGTWSAQLSLYGRELVAQNNIFGFANQIPGYSIAVELASMRPAASVPMPYPTGNCVLSKNDYRLTELPGWSETSNGCVVLQSYADLGGLGNEVKGNLVFETGTFPVGTGGPKEQVFEFKTATGLVHDNRIVGYPASDVTNPGIGQRLKAIGGHSSDMLADLEEAMAKRGDGLGSGEESVQKIGVSSPSPTPDLVTRALPATAGLLGNYPNPFNPSTSIKYVLPLISYVRMEVCNTLGQRVALLVDGVQLAGEHEVRFDASGLASGLYLCRLDAGNVVRTGRLLLMK